ncbi:hypothetical protein AVEN_72568-1 [Araneus ventricosus]|uniref:Uncharacterized protein n=1 Tax=Araneus ventricosus TaxID=182803 RepID=A0A4Y2W306_ARAVE|nr:hypothetical protein AVEN_142316-1 [Araneus ventricosus]GBO30904.1 hypothetical protein AVEN_59825-1 [Araneus ventricosus]GBO32435.1 hypothetical protein AVEN_72568-1 [Araneus ventricosus]
MPCLRSFGSTARVKGARSHMRGKNLLEVRILLATPVATGEQDVCEETNFSRGRRHQRKTRVVKSALTNLLKAPEVRWFRHPKFSGPSPQVSGRKNAD